MGKKIINIFLVSVFAAIIMLIPSLSANAALPTFPVKVNNENINDINKSNVLGNGEMEYVPATDTECAKLIIKENCSISRLEIMEDLILTSDGTKNVSINANGPILVGAADNGSTHSELTIMGANKNSTLTFGPSIIMLKNYRLIGIRKGNKLTLSDNAILSQLWLSDNCGAAVNVAAGAEFEMTGGLIEKCATISETYDQYHSTNGRGGAVFVEAGGTFKMSGGKISKCTASVAGGAIFSKGNVEISGTAEISECYVTGTDEDGTVKAKGGAVYILGQGTIKMTGGKISKNYLKDVEDVRGAGLYVSEQAEITLGGNAEISGNFVETKKTDSNLFIYDGVTINIDNPSAGMNVGLSTKTAPTKEAPVVISSSDCKNLVPYIFADDGIHDIYLFDGNWLLGVADTFKVSFDLGGHGELIAPVTVKWGNTIQKPANPSAAGYKFDGWYKDMAFTTVWDFDEGITKDTTIYAKWTKVAEPKPAKNPVVLLQASTKSKTVKLTWNKISNAKTYKVYGAACGKKVKELKKTSSTSYTVKKISGKKIKLNSHYKFYVVAYDKAGKALGQSSTIHYIAGNTKGKTAIVTKVKLNKTKVTLKAGKTFKLKVTKTLPKGKKHVDSSHGKATIYTSDTPGVATVSSKGVIKAVSKGTATIYVQDNGGKYAKIKVTVN